MFDFGFCAPTTISVTSQKKKKNLHTPKFSSALNKWLKKRDRTGSRRLSLHPQFMYSGFSHRSMANSSDPLSSSLFTLNGTICTVFDIRVKLGFRFKSRCQHRKMWKSDRQIKRHSHLILNR
ncbi:hypothetical protein Droror1_Dr00023996 [Drosera rotundifolia]